MNLNRFLTGLIVPSALLLACGGHVVSIGSDSEQLKTYDPSAVKVASTACPAGYQHPNICCDGGGSGQAAKCEAYVNHPFHACDQGWTAYPNALACCALDDPRSCVECDEKGNCAGGLEPPPTPVDPGQCPSACPPGYTGDGPDSPGGCCSYDPKSGTGTCFGSAHTDPPVPSPEPYPVVDAGPPVRDAAADVSVDGGPAPDGGVIDAGPPVDGGGADGGPGCACATPVSGSGGSSGGTPVPPSPDPGYEDGGVNCDCPVPVPPPPVCDNACPPNWKQAAPGVCCTFDPDGDQECFSTPRAVPAVPNATGTTDPNGGTVSVPPKR